MVRAHACDFFGDTVKFRENIITQYRWINYIFIEFHSIADTFRKHVSVLYFDQ